MTRCLFVALIITLPNGVLWSSFTEEDEASITALRGKGRGHRLVRGARWPSLLERSKKAEKTPEGLRVGRRFVRTRRGDYLKRDFLFEVVFSLNEKDSIAHVGIGEGRGRDGAYKDIANSVHMRIHHERLKSGVGLAKGNQSQGTRGFGPNVPTGVHRAIVRKQGNAITFAIDYGDDGPSELDSQVTLEDIQAFEPRMNPEKAHLFFGGGGTFQSVKMTIYRSTQ